MGKAKDPLPAKLIAGLIFKNEKILGLLKERLMERFGRIDYMGKVFSFDFTTYYEKEMGQDLKKQFLSFETLIHVETLPEIKLYTNQLEKEFCNKDSLKRKINIDPGYLTQEKMVLATTKNFDHRPYLNHGIHAELTYRFQMESFRVLEWTYPDYKTEQSINLFNEIRKIYVAQLKKNQEKGFKTQKKTH